MQTTIIEDKDGGKAYTRFDRYEGLTGNGAAAKEDTLRNRPRVIIKINCSTNGLVLAGYLVPFGISEIVVYDDEVDGIFSQVEQDPRAVETAKQRVLDEAAKVERGELNEDKRRHPNWVAEFSYREEREVKPLISAEKVGALSAPKSDAERKIGSSTDMLTSALEALLKLQQNQSGKSSSKAEK